MKRQSRIPAAAILVAALTIGGVYVSVFGRAGGRGGSSATLEQLESQATGSNDPNIWDAYGQKLFEAGQHDRALKAYRRAIELEPMHREARFHCAVALAAGEDRQACFDYMHDLVFSDPKLAEELFERPELSGCLTEGRFKFLVKEAHMQAMD